MSILFSSLPPELLAMIFELLDESDTLSLDVLLDPPNETRHMNKFLLKRMPIPVLAAQQIIHLSGAQTKGSYDWEQYSACKRALYCNSNYSDCSLFHDPDSIPMAIQYGDKTLALSIWPFIEKMLECFKDSFEYTRDDFFAHGMSRPSLLTPNCFDKPSNVELMRMVLAVYQFNAYCRLLSKSQRDMPFDEAKSIAEQFFKNLTPWEKEQLYSVALTAEIIVPVRRLDRDGLLFHDGNGDHVEPEDEPDVNGIPSARLRREAMRHPYPDYYKLHLRTPAFTSTTVIWRGFLDGVTDIQRSMKLQELKARPTPWSVALEKWAIVDYECPHHPCADVLDLLPHEAKRSTDAWERVIKLNNDSDSTDQAPYRAWQFYALEDEQNGTYDAAAKYMTCHDDKPWMSMVGYTFWTASRQASSWLNRMRDE